MFGLRLPLEFTIYSPLWSSRVSLFSQRESISASKELDNFGDREIRDIASQIMVGNVLS